MATSSQKERESGQPDQSGLASSQFEARYVNALRTTQMLYENPDLPDFMMKKMGMTPPEASAVLKRMGIITAPNPTATVVTKTGLAFYSSDDRTEVGKPPVKPPILVEASSRSNPALRIDTPFPKAAVITVNPPMDERMIQYSFVRNGILTPEEAEGMNHLKGQTGYLARLVLLDIPFQEGDAGHYDLETFIKSAYFDQVPAIKLNKGIGGILSKIGLGAVADASKHGNEVHVFSSKKGQALKTDTWEIGNFSATAGHPVLGRKVS